MSRKLDIASGIAVAFTLVTTLISADGSGAAAQSRTPVAVPAQATNPPLAGVPDSLLPEAYPAPVEPASGDVREALAPAHTSDNGLSLASLVAEQADAGAVTPELNCLAGAIYFEAKSETLEGQLAVGRVVVNRARSGRFPASYCGVVYQPSQFSFVHGKAMPAINRASRGWKDALAVARLADEDRWKGVAEGALYFHAARVSPNWRLTKVARIDNHVFYR